MESVEDKASDIRTIFKTDEFEEFYNGLDEKVKDKFEYTFELVQTVYAIPVKYVKHLEGTDLYEMRVSVGSNEYRTVLFAIDNSNVILSTKIILLNGFLKKSTKDYSKQIAKAERILKGVSVSKDFEGVDFSATGERSTIVLFVSFPNSLELSANDSVPEVIRLETISVEHIIFFIFIKYPLNFHKVLAKFIKLDSM